MARNFWKEINGRGNRKRQITGENFVYGVARVCFAKNIEAVPAGDMHFCSVLAKRKSEGTADQAGAKNRDPRNEMAARHIQAMRRPIAGAMMRSSPMSCANWPGSSDCAPSESAWSGSLWT